MSVSGQLSDCGCSAATFGDIVEDPEFTPLRTTFCFLTHSCRFPRQS